MKLRVLPTVAAALLVICWASAALACEHADKTDAAQAKAKAASTAAHAAANAERASCCGAKSTATAAARDARVTAVPVGSSCGSHGAKSTTAQAHGDCDWCNDVALCDEELGEIGVETQVVPLKNGVMILYTATAPRSVEAVQASVARRNERLSAVVAAGDRAHLCGKCKEMRGAMASGKMVRETVNIEGGCLTVITSTDPKLVAHIQAVSGVPANGRSKT